MKKYTGSAYYVKRKDHGNIYIVTSNVKNIYDHIDDVKSIEPVGNMIVLIDEEIAKEYDMFLTYKIETPHNCHQKEFVISNNPKLLHDITKDELEGLKGNKIGKISEYCNAMLIDKNK